MNTQPTPESLAQALAKSLGPGQVLSLTRLTGGATKSTWSFDWVGSRGLEPLILQQTPPPATDLIPGAHRPPKLDAEQDAAIMTAARIAGVPVPRVRHVLALADGLGCGYVTERVAGETLGRRIVSDAAFDAVRPTLAAQAGEILAAIHNMPAIELPFLRRMSAADELATYAGLLRGHERTYPALAWAIRWIRERLPTDEHACVVHADFRTGNLIVDPEQGIRCVLDWEISRIGDPMHDLGVLCMRSWRFGGAGEVGGFGSREALYSAYERAGGRIDTSKVRFWEAMSNLKWAIACVRRGLAGVGIETNVELAVVGRRLEEPLWDFMTLATAKE